MDELNTDRRTNIAGTSTQAPDAPSGASNQARDVAASTRDVASGAADQAASLAGQVKDKALSAASDQKASLADGIDGLAQAVHKSGEQFAGQQDWIAHAIESGAAELGALATSLRENDLGTLFSQVKSIAQRQPALFIGASLAAGFAVARLGKIVAADVSRDDLPTMPEVGHGGR
ncbi:hypothetical protein [Sphingomonas bacterium]|uniref:hypothetical protein n=1 Tax=Sphingomonas bacterium TaxID=1895847 RepID=UPI0015764B65|nr:hypothetical protein [Sphingomonas bacterium]